MATLDKLLRKISESTFVRVEQLETVRDAHYNSQTNQTQERDSWCGRRFFIMDSSLTLRQVIAVPPFTDESAVAVYEHASSY